MTRKDKFAEKWDREHVLHDAILLAFTTPQVYDYGIPPKDRVRTLVRMSRDRRRFPAEFNDEVGELVAAYRDEYCPLEWYLTQCDTVFGCEFFYGVGTWHRWRPGEAEKAQIRVDKYLPPHYHKYIARIHEDITITNVDPLTCRLGKVSDFYGLH